MSLGARMISSRYQHLDVLINASYIVVVTMDLLGTG